MDQSVMDVDDNDKTQTQMMVDADDKMQLDAEDKMVAQITSTPTATYFTADIQIADPYELQQIQEEIERMKKLNKQFQDSLNFHSIENQHDWQPNEDDWNGEDEDEWY